MLWGALSPASCAYTGPFFSAEVRSGRLLPAFAASLAVVGAGRALCIPCGLSVQKQASFEVNGLYVRPRVEVELAHDVVLADVVSIQEER
eukprot:7858106-Heterocapsa_arctica.AAC.1